MGVMDGLNGLSASLLGGLWRACFQGALLFGAVWLACRLLPRLPARARFVLWWLVCAKLVAGLALCAVALPLPLLPTHASGRPVGMRWLRRLAPPARIVSAPRAVYQVTEKDEPAAAPVKPDLASTAAPPSVPSASVALSVPSHPSPAAVLIALYLAGVLASVAATGRDALRVRRLLRAATPTEAFAAEAAETARAVGLARAPRVAVSETAPAPFVAGVLRPTVVLPAALAADDASPAERRMALAHEMAHLRRGDLWLALVPASARALFFFFPPVHAAVRECAACREEDCDRAALAATGAPAAGYARLLLAMVARQRAAVAPPALGMASPAALGQMKRRLRGIQGASLPVPRSAQAAALGLVGVATLGILPWRLTAYAARPGGAGAGTTPAADADAPLYEITDLGTLGGKYSDAFAINDAGDVVGTANVYPAGGMGHAFLYRDGRMTDLSAGSVYRHSLAFAVSDAGAVAASAYRSSYRATALNAFVWNGKRRVYLGSLPGYPFGKAVGVNGQGQVVGNALSGSVTDGGATVSRAFLWDAGRMRDLGTLGGPHSHALAVNDAGQVVGKADLPPDGDGDTDARPPTHAFLYQDGQMRDLGTLPGGRDSLASAVNDRGVAVGFSEAADGAQHAVRWENGTARDLGTPPGFAASAALGVNDDGVTVGQAGAGREPSAETRAVLWLPAPSGATARPVDLNARLASNPDGWRLEVARAVNARGQIVGRGLVNGQHRAFLLTPVASAPAAPAH
jgi:probable HAF family extracellular repeat protein